MVKADRYDSGTLVFYNTLKVDSHGDKSYAGKAGYNPNRKEMFGSKNRYRL